MKVLTKAEILEASQLPSEDVECEELGGMVRIRTLAGAEFERLATAKTFSATHMVAACAVGEDGKPIMTAEEWGAVPAPVLYRLYEVAAFLNNLGRQDELAKNS